MASLPSLTQQFLNVDSDFLQAVVSNPPTLDKFSKHFTNLQHSLKLAMLKPTEGIAVAQAAASRVAILADSLVELEATASEMEKELLQDVETLLQQLSISNEYSPPSRNTKYSSRQATCTRPPEYLEPAYAWFLSNIHNPYPPPRVKRILANQCKRTVHAIESWFKDVRRSIGWLDLCRSAFKGSRRAIIDAAHCAFVLRDPEAHLTESILSDFDALRSKLSNLYASRDGMQSHTFDDTFPRTTASSSSSPIPSLVSWSSESEQDDSPSTPPLPCALPIHGSSKPNTPEPKELSDFLNCQQDPYFSSLVSTPEPSNASASLVQNNSGTVPTTASRKRRRSESSTHCPKRPKVEVPSPTLPTQNALLPPDSFDLNHLCLSDFVQNFDIPPPQSTSVTEESVLQDSNVALIQNWDLNEPNETYDSALFAQVLDDMSANASLSSDDVNGETDSSAWLCNPDPLTWGMLPSVPLSPSAPLQDATSLGLPWEEPPSLFTFDTLDEILLPTWENDYNLLSLPPNSA